MANKACYPLCEDLPAAPCPLPLIPRTPELDGRLDAERSRVPDVGLTLGRWVMLCWEVVQDRVWVPKVLWYFQLFLGAVGAAGYPLLSVSALLSSVPGSASPKK